MIKRLPDASVNCYRQWLTTGDDEAVGGFQATDGAKALASSLRLWVGPEPELQAEIGDPIGLTIGGSCGSEASAHHP